MVWVLKSAWLLDPWFLNVSCSVVSVSEAEVRLKAKNLQQPKVRIVGVIPREFPASSTAGSPAPGDGLNRSQRCKKITKPPAPQHKAGSSNSTKDPPRSKVKYQFGHFICSFTLQFHVLGVGCQLHSHP